MATVEEISNMTRNEFIAYYSNSMIFGINPVENAEIFIGNRNFIMFRYINCEYVGEQVKIPHWVNSYGTPYGNMVCEQKYPHVNIDELNLGNVDSITDFGFYGHTVRKLIGKKVKHIGEQGCSFMPSRWGINGRLEIDFPNLETIGRFAFMGTRVHNLICPKVKVLYATAFYMTSVNYIEFDNLKKIIVPNEQIRYPEIHSKSEEIKIYNERGNRLINIVKPINGVIRL